MHVLTVSAYSEQAQNGHRDCTGRCIAKDPRKYSFECQVVCVRGSQESNTRGQAIGTFQTGT